MQHFQFRICRCNIADTTTQVTWPFIVNTKCISDSLNVLADCSLFVNLYYECSDCTILLSARPIISPVVICIPNQEDNISPQRYIVTHMLLFALIKKACQKVYIFCTISHKKLCVEMLFGLRILWRFNMVISVISRLRNRIECMIQPLASIIDWLF